MTFLRKFLEWGLNGNVWIWFHMLFGGIGARVGEALGYSDLKTLIIIFLCAVGWEVVEFIIDGGIEGMIKIYGSLERWAYDCAGDVLGALIMALMVVM
jgi:hypothetical protein